MLFYNPKLNLIVIGRLVLGMTIVILSVIWWQSSWVLFN